MKFLLIVVLFCGTAMAEGEMGGGGYAPPPCTPDCPPPPPCEDEENCLGMPSEIPGTIKLSDKILIYAAKFVISTVR